MGKAAILAILAFSITGAYFAMGSQEGMMQAERRLAGHQYEVLSRNAALAGYDRAKQALTEDFYATPASMSGTFEGSTYDVTVTFTGAKAKVVSEGRTSVPGGDPITFQIISEIEREVTTTIAEEPPAFMQYALLTDRDLYLNGDILADLYVQGDAENTLNANMHSNGNLYIKGNSVQVKGFGTFAGWGAANPNSALQSSFQPYYNPTDAPVSSQASYVPIPAFDAATFTSKVTVDRTSMGDVTLSGVYNLGGTREDPYVWHIYDDLTASGNVELSGYVLFIVNDDVTFAGNVRAGTTGYDGADESNIAFYVGDDVEMGGNTEIFGQIFSGGGVAFLHGNPTVYGSVTTRGTADLRGTPQIYYRPASPALTTIFQDPEIRFQMLSYSEW